MKNGEELRSLRSCIVVMDDPTRHVNFGVSMKWKSLKDQVLRGLGSDEFENWLWSQGK